MKLKISVETIGLAGCHYVTVTEGERKWQAKDYKNWNKALTRALKLRKQQIEHEQKYHSAF